MPHYLNNTERPVWCRMRWKLAALKETWSALRSSIQNSTPRSHCEKYLATKAGLQQKLRQGQKRRIIFAQCDCCYNPHTLASESVCQMKECRVQLANFICAIKEKLYYWFNNVIGMRPPRVSHSLSSPKQKPHIHSGTTHIRQNINKCKTTIIKLEYDVLPGHPQSAPWGECGEEISKGLTIVCTYAPTYAEHCRYCQYTCRKD